MLDTVRCPGRALYAGQMVSDGLGVSGGRYHLHGIPEQPGQVVSMQVGK